MASKVNCEFLRDGNCFSIMANDEAKETRIISCSNSNVQACCYLCNHSQGCEISCHFLGENKREPRNNQPENSSEDDKIQVLKCALCDSKMLHTKMNLRAEGWGGITQALPLGMSEIGETTEELLPVIIYVCPKCGKLEFMAEEKTKQKIINRS
jgi:hypothetical protein